MKSNRRQFLQRLGLTTAAIPFLPPLASLAESPASAARKRLVFVFTPNGTVPEQFWPDETGPDFKLKRILAPLEPFKKRLTTLRGISNKVRGDGDGHMRGMSCLLTGIELFPGNIQGGSDSPAGWASGISIDQEVKNFLQGRPESATRFGSLELGVAVPHRADPWTRWSYAGPNQPMSPASDPYDVFEKLYGQMKDRDSLGSILDEVTEDLGLIAARLPAEERALLDRHATFVRDMEGQLKGAASQKLAAAAPQLPAGVKVDNDGMPEISAMQSDLLVNAFANDLLRVASIQFTNSVGQARMHWLGIEEGHHSLSHDPDLNLESLEKLIKINTWYAEQVASLAAKLDAIPEPGGSGSLLDNTTIVWTNELGKGNSHSHDDIPFVLLGSGLGLPVGHALKFESIAHNRLLMRFAHGMGHEIATFGNKTLCEGGPLN